MIESESVDMKNILTQFLGQTYGELHKLDTNIIGTSNNLTPKSQAFASTAAQVLNSVVQPQNSGAVLPEPAHTSTQLTAQPPPLPARTAPDINQLEFSFDDSATAKNIKAAIDRLDGKVDRLIKLLEQSKK